MERQFFVDGGFVTLQFIEAILDKKNRNQTVEEFLTNYHLIGLEHYILSPAFLLETLYGTFLVRQDLFVKIKDDEEKEEERKEKLETLEKIFSQFFKVTKIGKRDTLYRCLRNALAHYNIDFRMDGVNPIVHIFQDKDPQTGEVHFEAEINNVQLRILLLKLAEVL